MNNITKSDGINQTKSEVVKRGGIKEQGRRRYYISLGQFWSKNIRRYCKPLCQVWLVYFTSWHPACHGQKSVIAPQNPQWYFTLTCVFSTGGDTSLKFLHRCLSPKLYLKEIPTPWTSWVDIDHLGWNGTKK